MGRYTGGFSHSKGMQQLCPGLEEDISQVCILPLLPCVCVFPLVCLCVGGLLLDQDSQPICEPGTASLQLLVNLALVRLISVQLCTGPLILTYIIVVYHFPVCWLSCLVFFREKEIDEHYLMCL